MLTVPSHSSKQLSSGPCLQPQFKTALILSLPPGTVQNSSSRVPVPSHSSKQLSSGPCLQPKFKTSLLVSLSLATVQNSSHLVPVPSHSSKQLSPGPCLQPHFKTALFWPLSPARQKYIPLSNSASHCKNLYFITILLSTRRSSLQVPSYSNQTDTAVCCLPSRQQYPFDICLLLYVQS